MFTEAAGGKCATIFKMWLLGQVRNEAVAWATGDIIVNMDDDDVYGPSYISFMVSDQPSPRPVGQTCA